MDWNATIEMVRGASTLYWVAAAAIAAGMSLLAAASVLHLKRRAPRAARPPRQATVTPPAAVPVAGGYAPAAMAPAPVAPPRPDLARVTARLAAAADRLAAVQAELAVEHPVAEGSFLKESPSNVEYVFRTGEA